MALPQGRRHPRRPPLPLPRLHRRQPRQRHHPNRRLDRLPTPQQRPMVAEFQPLDVGAKILVVGDGHPPAEISDATDLVKAMLAAESAVAVERQQSVQHFVLGLAAIGSCRQEVRRFAPHPGPSVYPACQPQLDENPHDRH